MRKALYFLGILNDADIDWLVAAGSRREVAAGKVLIEEGRAIDSVFLVFDGAFLVRTRALGEREIARLHSNATPSSGKYASRTCSVRVTFLLQRQAGQSCMRTGFPVCPAAWKDG
jgi:CRP-like cAMP-binding protein